jgi:hypothetical protein
MSYEVNALVMLATDTRKRQSEAQECQSACIFVVGAGIHRYIGGKLNAVRIFEKG